MSELHPVSQHREDAKGDVVFAHGLGGDWWSTWAAEENQKETFWPRWLADQLPQANVWSLEYGAHPSEWRGAGMSVIEHADNVLELLLTKRLGFRPLIFVAHSLGGLLVKNLLRASREAPDEEARRIAAATRGVTFFATPNSGALIASTGVRLLGWLGPLGQLSRISPLVHELRAHSPELLRLNQWYRNQVADPVKGLRIKTKVYYEKRGTAFGFLLVVDEASADPGLAGIRPVPVPADHFMICKFAARDSWLYENVRQFLEECLASGSPPPDLRGSVASKLDHISTSMHHPSNLDSVTNSTSQANRILLGVAIDTSGSMQASINNKRAEIISRFDAVLSSLVDLGTSIRHELDQQQNVTSDAFKIFLYCFGLRFGNGVADMASLWRAARSINLEAEISTRRQRYEAQARKQAAEYGSLGSLARSYGLGGIVDSIANAAENSIRDRIVREVGDLVLHEARRLGDQTLSPKELAEMFKPSPSGPTKELIEQVVYGSTPLAAAAHEIRERFERADNNTYDHKVLLVISDGEPTDGDPREYIEKVRNSNVTVIACFVTDDDVTEPKKLVGLFQSLGVMALA